MERDSARYRRRMQGRARKFTRAAAARGDAFGSIGGRRASPLQTPRAGGATARLGRGLELAGREVGRAAEDRKLAAHEEPPDVLECERPVGAIPVPDAVVDAEDRSCQEEWVGLGNEALLHPTGEECPPHELEVAHARAGGGARGLL